MDFTQAPGTRIMRFIRSSVSGLRRSGAVLTAVPDASVVRSFDLSVLELAAGINRRWYDFAVGL